MTREEFYEKYKDVEFYFKYYWKYTFTYVGEYEGKVVSIGVGGDSGAYYRDWETDRKSTRLNSSHSAKSRMPSSA